MYFIQEITYFATAQTKIFKLKLFKIQKLKERDAIKASLSEPYANPSMKEKIAAVFKERSEIPLFYVENGSRLWGTANSDSDYDVRGFHLPSKAQYFDYKKQRELIEIMDGTFDFVSYDIDKMFGLLAKSNPATFEWVRAHIVYFNILPNWEVIQQEIVDNIEFKSLFHHYLSIAKRHIQLLESNKKFTNKVLFYGIRGLLSAELAAQKVVPELIIDQLFAQYNKENELIKIAKDSLEEKKSGQEKITVAEKERAKILDAIKLYLNKIQQLEVEKSNKGDKLALVLKDYCFHLKTTYYK